MKPWWPHVIVKPSVRLQRPRFATPSRPPSIVLFGILFIAIMFLLGGNIYTLVRNPPPIATDSSGNAILIAPATDVQLGLEGIVASVIAAIGVIGLGLVYYSSRYVFQPGYATRLLILGMIIAGVAFLTFSYLYRLK